MPAVKQIENQVQIEIRWKFSAIDAALQRPIRFLPPRPQKARAKLFHQFWV